MNLHQRVLQIAAGDADPLFHAPGEFSGALVQGVIHVHQGQIMRSPVMALLFDFGRGQTNRARMSIAISGV